MVFQSIPTSLKNTLSEPRISPVEKINIENNNITGIRYNRFQVKFIPIKYMITINGINASKKLISSLPSSVKGKMVFGRFSDLIICVFFINAIQSWLVPFEKYNQNTSPLSTYRG